MPVHCSSAATSTIRRATRSSRTLQIRPQAAMPDLRRATTVSSTSSRAAAVDSMGGTRRTGDSSRRCRTVTSASDWAA